MTINEIKKFVTINEKINKINKKSSSSIKNMQIKSKSTLNLLKVKKNFLEYEKKFHRRKLKKLK